jgi:hypothetical protein
LVSARAARGDPMNMMPEAARIEPADGAQALKILEALDKEVQSHAIALISLLAKIDALRDVAAGARPDAMRYLGTACQQLAATVDGRHEQAEAAADAIGAAFLKITPDDRLPDIRLVNDGSNKAAIELIALGKVWGTLPPIVRACVKAIIFGIGDCPESGCFDER